MQKQNIKIFTILAALFAGMTSTYILFNYRFIKVSVDYLSFTAGVFLVADGVLAVFREKNIFSRKQITRLLRIVFGLCILIIHALQFWHYRVMSSEIAKIQINLVDYLAIPASIFLIVEGTVKILRSGLSLSPENAVRLFRIMIGAIVLSIHILQFTHFLGN